MGNHDRVQRQKILLIYSLSVRTFVFFSRNVIAYFITYFSFGLGVSFNVVSECFSQFKLRSAQSSMTETAKKLLI